MYETCSLFLYYCFKVFAKVWSRFGCLSVLDFSFINSNALGGGLHSPSALFDMNTLLGAYGLHEFDEMVGWTEEE